LLRNGLVYLHIPKTGGNWLTRLLHDQDLVIDTLGHKHATYEALVGTTMDDTESAPRQRIQGFFCVVRHPLRWYESWFKYQCSRGWRDWGQAGNLQKWHVMCDLNTCKAEEFNAFMMQVNRTQPGYVHHLYARYAGGSMAHVLKTETVADDFIALARQTGLEIDEAAARAAPPFGVSPPLEIEWDREILRETIENERPSFRRYGYAPDPLDR
jgi:hypothetical protein